MEVRPARRCSSCGQQGHNARTCLEKDERVGCARPVDITFHEAPSQDAYEQQGSADGSSFLQGLAPRLLGVANHSLSGSESEAQNASQLPHISRERRRGESALICSWQCFTYRPSQHLGSRFCCSATFFKCELLCRYSLDGGGAQGISGWPRKAGKGVRLDTKMQRGTLADLTSTSQV